MKFIAPLFFATALAWSNKRQSGVSTITDALQSVTDATQKLGTAIRAFDGQVNTALAVNGASSDVLDAIKKGTTAVDAVSSISQDETLTLVNPTNALNDAVKATTDSLVSKKPLFDANGFTQIVINNLLDQQKASQAFSAAVVSKVPEGIQGIAANLAKPASDDLASAIAAFRSGSSASSSAAAPATTTTPTGGVVTQIGDGQIQAPGPSASSIPSSIPASKPSSPPSSAPTTTASASKTASSPASPASSSPAAYTGAAGRTTTLGYGAFAAAAIAVLAM